MKDFFETANASIHDMYQAIFDPNVTAFLLNREGEVEYIWQNMAAMKKNILRIHMGQTILDEEPSLTCMLRAMEENEGREENGTIATGSSMVFLAIPLHDHREHVCGCLGCVLPTETGVLGYVRRVMRLTVEAVESRWQARTYREDYMSMYQKFLGVMETMPMATIVTDNELKIQHVNEATERLLDMEIHQLIDQDVDELLDTGGFFRKLFLSMTIVVDKEMTFRFQGSELKCEVLTTLILGKVGAGHEGMVIKLKNAEYLRVHKKSKSSMKAQFDFEDIQGTSAEIQEAVRLGKIAARSRSNVLLLGETGTGKELFAQAVHNHSLRREGPFVAVNCGAMTSSLMESELFGYEPGAFTGASEEGKKGKFEEARGGTLFLDEIGDISRKGQVNLLRVLQNKEVVRVGGSKPIPTDVRIIAATNKDIDTMAEEGQFRRDLYYRLNVFSIRIPSLAERQRDVQDLADYFVKRYSVLLDREVQDISPSARAVLQAHHWPGNIRELENVIERAINVAQGDTIQVEDLPFFVRNKEPKIESEERVGDARELPRVQMVEKAAIVEALKKHRGNVSRAADALGLGRRSLYRRLESYQIRAREYR